jgi:hypothetical protein
MTTGNLRIYHPRSGPVVADVEMAGIQLLVQMTGLRLVPEVTIIVWVSNIDFFCLPCPNLGRSIKFSFFFFLFETS